MVFIAVATLEGESGDADLPYVLAAAEQQCHAPVAQRAARRYFGDRVLYAPNCYQAAEGSDGVFLVTEWNEFRRPDLARVRRLMRTPVFFDGRNVFDPRKMRELGFTYFGIGRP